MIRSSVFRPPLVLLMVMFALTLLNACSQPSLPSASESASSRNAVLGTQWGESLASRISTVQLRRMGSDPLEIHTLRYSAASSDGERLRELSLANGRVGLRVLRDTGSSWPIYRESGTKRLQGVSGERYILEYRNYSKSRTFEIVATVDGLDVLNGQSGSTKNRGYVLRPRDRIRIAGFRKSTDEVAAFRFGNASDSYAANTNTRSMRNVGAIGTAVFELTVPPGATSPTSAAACGYPPCAFPGNNADDQGYARPPAYD